MHMLETRLIRARQARQFADLLNPATAATAMATLASPTRSMMGSTQMQWLQGQLAASKATWQVLGQQVLMARMAFPVSVLSTSTRTTPAPPHWPPGKKRSPTT
jgi:alkaline phosphatase D